MPINTDLTLQLDPVLGGFIAHIMEYHVPVFLVADTYVLGEVSLPLSVSDPLLHTGLGDQKVLEYSTKESWASLLQYCNDDYKVSFSLMFKLTLLSDAPRTDSYIL